MYSRFSFHVCFVYTICGAQPEAIINNIFQISVLCIHEDGKTLRRCLTTFFLCDIRGCLGFGELSSLAGNKSAPSVMASLVRESRRTVGKIGDSIWATGGEKENLTVGYLTAVTGSIPHRQGISISGAMLLALEKVNNDSELLPGVNLVLKYGDTKVGRFFVSRLDR